jgi:hypothetical protein
MAEETINGVRVVFRDKFSAREGWGLLAAVRRIDQARSKALVDAGGSADFMATLLNELEYEDVVKFVRGAVAEWDFPGDLNKPDCCDGMNTIHEFVPLVTEAVLLFYTANDREKLAGEAESGSTSPSEG